ncbi:hypothetical protein L1987_33159 [Smallanthus sonchifolius]|uniref:Uncharacterized protein n=1 Tax=Smallanthus sonchifolius TaxID=185202 RepID=A0ACB9HQA2_9ASTR|nr:hypothetical protein L1987_33159 [Smallanthus sonchifolius]
MISETWICFLVYPFTLGLSYPFPPLITDFFKFTGLSPKFAELVPARSDTEKRIEALLEIPVAERVPKSSSQFALSDLDSLLSGATIVKKEGSTPATTKSRIPLLRFKASGSKKRKMTDIVDLEIFEGMDSTKTAKKLQSLLNLGLEKLSVNLATAEKNAEEALEKIEDMKKISATKSKYLEKEIQTLKDKLQENSAQYEQKMQETMDDAKKSMTMAILQSRIQMAEQAVVEGFDLAAWDLQGWRTSLAKLGGEAGETSKVVEDLGAGDGEKQADQGNEGNDA